MADLVAMLNERDLNAQVTLRQTVHNAAYRTERTNQAATESECGQSRDEQSRQTARGDPDGAAEHHRIESKLPCFLRRNLAGFGFFLVIRQDLLRGLDQIEHLGPTLFNDGIAKDHHLSG